MGAGVLTTSQIFVAVVGPGEGATAQECDRAREAGRLLAAAGAVVVTGGLGGVMGAAAEGSSEAGGTSVAPGAEPAATVAQAVDLVLGRARALG